MKIGLMLGSLDMKSNVVSVVADLHTRSKTMYLQILTLDASLIGLICCARTCSFKVPSLVEGTER